MRKITENSSKRARRETLAGLRLLARLARAGGEATEEERTLLAEAVNDAELPPEVSTGSLLAEQDDIDPLIDAITSEQGRETTFAACFTMAHANRECLPAEQEMLDRISEAWAVPAERRSVLERIVDEARDTVWVGSGEPIADPELRSAEIRGEIMKYSVISAVLGLNPIPVASLATDFAVVGLQVKMFSDIGRHWGHRTSRDAATQVLAGIGVGSGVRLATNALLKFVPGAGMAFAASTNFASTWAVGQVANQYWESGGKADSKMLKDLFVASRSEGRKKFSEHRTTVEEKRHAEAATLDALGADYAAGRLTLAEYQRQIDELR